MAEQAIEVPNDTVLNVDGLKTYFFTRNGVVKAVDGVSFNVGRSETLAIVGESGCGKSMTALSLMRLIPEPPGKIIEGTIHLDGRNLMQLSEDEMRAVRGNDISMIFQEPMTSLNPVMTIGTQISEALILHQKLSKAKALARSIEMLQLVRIPEPEQRAKEYPHQLSGGMRQRAMIAMALSTKPKVLIADEPTTALDVTIQAQVLDLMKDLVSEFGMAILFITHDLSVIAQTADRVAVMYLGRILETGTVRQGIQTPVHPYTQGLLNSLPKLDALDEPLTPVAGDIPSPLERPPGCVFHTRCPKAKAGVCDQTIPELFSVDSGQSAACFALTGGW